MVWIGIDLGGTSMKAGVVDGAGRILAKADRPTLAQRPYEAVIQDMAGCAQEALERAGLTLENLAGVGVGIPGVADMDTGRVIFCTNLGWRNVPLREIFRRFMDKPVLMDNDATVAALAESVAGVSAGSSSSVFVTLGTGVGGGVILGGKVWRGAHGVGTEIGHMILEMDGVPCTCGNRGCLERYCSATAIIRMARELTADHPESLICQRIGGDVEKLNAKIVLDAAKEGDPIAMKVFRRYVTCLSQALASIMQLLDPEVMVLGGGVSKAGAFLLDAVREETPKYLLFKDLPHARIELARLGSDAGMIGAAMLGWK